MPRRSEHSAALGMEQVPFLPWGPWGQSILPGAAWKPQLTALTIQRLRDKVKAVYEEEGEV